MKWVDIKKEADKLVYDLQYQEAADKYELAITVAGKLKSEYLRKVVTKRLENKRKGCLERLYG